MAEVDLLSEEVDQAKAKLKGVARLLGTAMTPAEVLGSQGRENARTENHDKILGASPSLRGQDLSELPAWAESHDCDTCQCHECATFGPTQLACLQLINLQVG